MKVKFVLILLFGLNVCWGNKIQVTNVSITSQNTDEDFTMVEFDILWENSWRVIGGPNNWDAAWIFIKYRIGTGGNWKHAWLNNIGHVHCAGTITSTGFLDPASPFDAMTNPGMGVFIYRAEVGSGTFECQNVQLRWNYGAQGITDNEQIDIQVFAIEHVYIPAGAFKVGSGGTEPGAFYTYQTTTQPFVIGDESEIIVGTNAGNLYYSTALFSGDQSGPIPQEYPKGVNAFYVMKYEISQQGYVDFLNSLTRSQQVFRVRSNITGTSVTSQYVLSTSSSIGFRNSVWSFSTIPALPSPVIFFCNYNGNQVGDEYAWGNTFIYPSDGIANAGMPNELPANEVLENLSNCSASQNNNLTSIYRCGVFARPGTDRTHAGATYYGALDFSGNAKERAVCVGTSSGRSFKGFHGNGLLNVNGNANGSTWPDPSSEIGVIDRGGGWGTTYDTFQDLEISFRVNSVDYSSINVGGRGVRTAP